MITWLINLINDWLNSFNTHKPGMSARKICACVITLVASYLAIRHTTSENLDSVLITCFFFVAACLGMVTYEQLAQLKGGKITNSSSSTTTEKSETSTVN